MEVEDLDGSSPSCFAPRPRRTRADPGEWLVVHSGYAIDRVDATEAEAVAAELSASGHEELSDNGSTVPAPETAREVTAVDPGLGTVPPRPKGEGSSGVAVAGMTALISGLSVFVNSYGVHSIAAPSVYTTAKNLVATVILATGALVAWAAPAVGGTRSPVGSSR